MEDGGGATNKTVPFSSIILRIHSTKKTLMMMERIKADGIDVGELDECHHWH